jgi:hypothetical protein
MGGSGGEGGNLNGNAAMLKSDGPVGGRRQAVFMIWYFLRKEKNKITCYGNVTSVTGSSSGLLQLIANKDFLAEIGLGLF